VKTKKLISFLLLSVILTIVSCKENIEFIPFNVHNSVSDREIIQINKVFNSDTVIDVFDDKKMIFGIDISAKTKLNNDESFIKVILLDNSEKQHLIYEANRFFSEDSVSGVEKFSDETAILNAVTPKSIKLLIKNAQIEIEEVRIYTSFKDDSKLITNLKDDVKSIHDSIKLQNIRAYIKKNNLKWKADHTSLSMMRYEERLNFLGEILFPPGLEFYSGGIFQSIVNLPKAEVTKMVPEWTWRNRHGIDWTTPIRQQGECGSCWIFGNMGATEALVNLYFNKKIDLDLSEQNVLSCTDIPWGGCHFGIPSVALNYLTDHGTVDEESYPYLSKIEECDVPKDPKEHIKISGFKHFSTLIPGVEERLKKTIINYGPVGECVYYSPKLKDQVHVMTNLGWYTDDDGHTVWIFKSSWGTEWGDKGYMHTKLLFPLQSGFIYHQETPIESLIVEREVNCTDNDGDGYYFWGIGEKPANCPPCPDEADCDDSDPKLGPMDEYGYCTPINQ